MNGKIRDYIFEFLAIVFLVVLVISFYTGKLDFKKLDASSSDSVLTDSQNQAEAEAVSVLGDSPDQINANFDKKYKDYLNQQETPLDKNDKDWQLMDFIELEHGVPFYNYKIGTAEFKIYHDVGINKDARVEVFNNGENLKNTTVTPPDFFVINKILALRHKGDKYVFLQNWTGAAHCCREEYVFRLDENNNLKPIELLNLMDGELSSDSIIQKNGFLYLKVPDYRFRYFHTSFAGSPIFFQYLSISDGKFLIRNGDFTEEYINQAKEDRARLDDYLLNTEKENIKFYEWSPLLVEQTVNYLMGGLPNEAWNLFDNYFEKFAAASPDSLLDFDSFLTGYSSRNIVSLDQFKLEIKKLLLESSFGSIK